MLTELTPNDFARTADLFRPLDYHLAVPAVLAGTASGRVFVDDPAHPRAALLWTGHRFYLAGDPEQGPFLRALSDWWLNRLFPEHPEHEYGLYYPTPAWEEALRSAILPGYPPVPGPRAYYSLDTAAWAGSPLIPPEFQLRSVDADLLAQPGLAGLDELTEEMQSERESVEDFLAHSFGVVLVDPQAEGAPGGKIITWCLSEYNLGERCEVGIATDPAYRKRGLAAATGAAFVEQARARGIRKIGWHCWLDNHGSRAAARRIGYQLEGEYQTAFVIANPVVNLAVHGIISLEKGNYPAAADWLSQALALGEAPWWVSFRAACAAARLAQPAQALAHLEQAAARGMADAGWLKTVDHLESLHAEPGWQVLLAGLEMKSEGNG